MRTVIEDKHTEGKRPKAIKITHFIPVTTRISEYLF